MTFHTRRHARAYFGDEPALGRTVRLAFGAATDIEIVGVVGDLRNASGAGWEGSGHALKQTAAPGMFVPAAQGVPLIAGFGFDAHWLVRSWAAPAATALLVADIVQAAEPRLRSSRSSRWTRSAVRRSPRSVRFSRCWRSLPASP